MAKWGEGDPRWIVEERPDATNVNNWHWTEKDATLWSKDKLKNLLVDFELKTKAGEGKITELERCEGEASANNRKAKLIVFYEWDLKLKWTGRVYGNDTPLNGTVKIPNLSDENSVDDLDINFSIDSNTPEALKMKDALRTEGVKLLKARLQSYIDALNKEYTQGMILPKKDGSAPTADSKMNKMSSGFDKCSINNSKPDPAKSKPQIGDTVMSSLTSSTEMKCKAADLYSAFTQPALFNAFTNGSGKINGVVGGTFEMFGGNVHGKILELEEDKKIVQDWRFKNWPEGHFSRVVITMEETEEATKVTVKQTAVPEFDLDKTKEGWEKYYWEAIKRTFGFGSYMH